MQKRVQTILIPLLRLNSNVRILDLSYREQNHGRYGADPVARGYRSIVIDVDLRDFHSAFIVRHQRLDRGTKDLTGTTLISPEIYEDGNFRAKHFAVEILVGHNQSLGEICVSHDFLQY